jgi:hypothetical protein
MPIRFRSDFDPSQVLTQVSPTKDGQQARRLLALAAG